MIIGFVGLGRMGANMVRRLLRANIRCVVYDRAPETVAALAAEGAEGAASYADLVARLPTPRMVWLMLPAGSVTEQAVDELGQLLAAGDCLIDGGNTHYKDDQRRAKLLQNRGIDYLDVGTSGGVWGLERGYCLMIGGAPSAVQRLTPIFAALSPGSGTLPPTAGLEHSSATQGYLYCGPAGAGHFAKMIHNGIEYGLMQAYAEGFELLHHADRQGYQLPLAELAELWRRGSVISSWLLDLTARALAEDETLGGYHGSVADSGEGRWTVETALEQGTPADVLTTALYKRFRSRQSASFAEKLLSALRHQFGGHREAPRE